MKPCETCDKRDPCWYSVIDNGPFALAACNEPDSGYSEYGTVTGAVLAYLKRHGSGSATSIAAETGLPAMKVRAAITKLHYRKEVCKTNPELKAANGRPVLYELA